MDFIKKNSLKRLLTALKFKIWNCIINLKTDCWFRLIYHNPEFHWSNVCLNTLHLYHRSAFHKIEGEGLEVRHLVTTHVVIDIFYVTLKAGSLDTKKFHNFLVQYKKVTTLIIVDIWYYKNLKLHIDCIMWTFNIFLNSWIKTG